MVHVRFRRPWGPYQAGDTGELDPPIAEILGWRGIADPVRELESAATERTLERAEVREKPRRKKIP